MSEYCEAVLRPEGIACTMKPGHDRFLDSTGTSWDHCNLARPWIGGRMTRPGVYEWGFNDPL